MASFAASGDDDRKSKIDKFCRVCTDFKTWMKEQSKTKNAILEGTGDGDRPKRTDCPLDKDELGRSTWAFLHTIGATYPDQPTTQESADMSEFIRLFSHFYPCAPCAEDFREKMKTLPPRTESRSQLARWFCEMHNDVNRRLGKKEFDCRLVDERWKDGWKGGSCDT